MLRTIEKEWNRCELEHNTEHDNCDNRDVITNVKGISTAIPIRSNKRPNTSDPMPLTAMAIAYVTGIYLSLKRLTPHIIAVGGTQANRTYAGAFPAMVVMESQRLSHRAIKLIHGKSRSKCDEYPHVKAV
jgi:hypothetical protein